MYTRLKGVHSISQLFPKLIASEHSKSMAAASEALFPLKAMACRKPFRAPSLNSEIINFGVPSYTRKSYFDHETGWLLLGYV